jgi:hypothetical protein
MVSRREEEELEVVMVEKPLWLRRRKGFFLSSSRSRGLVI